MSGSIADFYYLVFLKKNIGQQNICVLRFSWRRRGNVAGSSVLGTIKHDTVISGAKLLPNVGVFVPNYVTLYIKISPRV
jgi:hypothetical protein